MKTWCKIQVIIIPLYTLLKSVFRQNKESRMVQKPYLQITFEKCFDDFKWIIIYHKTNSMKAIFPIFKV